MAALRSSLGIPGPLQLLLLLLLQDLIAGGPKLDVRAQESVSNHMSIAAGRTLTLNCTLTLMDLPGAAEWAKDGSRVIYKENEESSSRAMRVVPGSRTDFSISISNVRPEDGGSYDCSRTKPVFQKGGTRIKKEIMVSVIAGPLLHGPPGRITAESRAPFNCSAEGFSSREVTVLWLKDGKEVGEAQTNILDSGGKQSISYRVESTVEVLLGRGDVKSQLTCWIKHSSLEAPLQQDFPLGAILRVPPKVTLDTSPPSPVQMNAAVMVTCNAENFYPDNAKVDLFTKNPSGKAKTGSATLNSDGTSSLKSYMMVVATKNRNSSLFTCLVKHDSQPAIKATAEMSIKTESEKSSQQQLIFGLWMGLFLNKVAMAVFLLGLFQIKERGCSAARCFSRSPQEVRQAESST